MLGGRAPRTPATPGPARAVPDLSGLGRAARIEAGLWSRAAVAYILGKTPMKATIRGRVRAKRHGGAVRHGCVGAGDGLTRRPGVAGIAQSVRAPGCGPGGHRF